MRTHFFSADFRLLSSLSLKIEIKDLPYTTPNQKLFAILAKILERDMMIWEALGCFPKNEIGMTAMIKEVCPIIFHMKY